MSGFTKLVPEIVQSSIWNEPSDIRIVWITLLAIKDENGYVRGDARTVARMANVSIEVVAEALAKFQEPDPHSHTPDNDGRRIGPAAGGWVVLNHALYRGRDERAVHAEYVRNWRKKNSKKDDVNTCDSLVNTCDSPSASVSVSVSDREGVQGETEPKAPRFVDPIRWTPEGSFKGITDKDYDAWELAYPAVVIDSELEKANQWLLGNPAKAKKKQWRKFITGWLGRAQERGGR